jgi:UTP--glucose-1-phosphate uridylyltransferase
MENFNILYNKYKHKKHKYIDWNKIQQIDEHILTQYEELKNKSNNKLTKKVCSIKLNGGLGTSMGLNGPKSLLKAKNSLTFMDITIEQTKKSDVQLVLMNSFYTHGQTDEYLNSKKVDNVIQFEQSCYPRILAETNEPLTSDPSNCDNKNYLYPPGHGDLLQSLYDSGTLQKLLDQGIEYAFISNIDNLGATVDYNILNDFIESESDFALELTNKNVRDTKGGTLIKYQDNYKMFEVAQCPPEHLGQFTSLDVFKFFNTNNLWIKLEAVEKVIKSNYLEHVDLIINPKKLKDGRGCIQLEYAIGGLVSFFDNIKCYLVPRSRFIPVKRNHDLDLVRSSQYLLDSDWILNKV